MSFLVKRQSWSRFGVKAAVVFLLITVFWLVFKSRFSIGIDTQLVKCIPGYTVYLIDKHDKTLIKDEIFVVLSSGLNPIYEDGTQLVKYLRGEPGDLIEIKDNHNIYVDGEFQGHGLSHSQTLHSSPESYMGSRTLKADEYWFMGISDRSFDSRYWGSASSEQVYGKAYPIF
ncbi:S26 family signal peptidase [Marinomonas algarum]|uniref:S26 family signal peptidase n=1 Tax=Marinomonas algarum TaxID=2883105 RepID=A0A9X1INN0_9GAMM|nr:S26 family signal peptidase [Marinomonas algarum]MCB5162652.1 S26 family signal peptidase [Marinomonas algarum]